MTESGDYISREAVKQIIAAQCGECADACLEFDGIQPDCNQCLLHGAKKAIESIPAADVRPVERGKWVDMGDFISCSSCNATRLKEFESDYGKVMRLDARTKFCPNCGADMRGESDV